MNLTELRCRPLWTLIFLLLLGATFYSCKKADNVPLNDRNSYVEKFFKKTATNSRELEAIIDLLKSENDKTGFVNRLPDSAGLPVWNKLIAQRTKTNYAARGIIADNAGNMLIPLSNDNSTLSALLFAMKHDNDYEFYCYDNNYAYGITFSDKYTIKQREMVIGLFMGMSNYVFGANKFKSIPQELFEGYENKPEENGITKRIFLKLADGTLPDIFISGLVTAPFTKCYWEFTGICNCSGSNNTPENCHHPNSYCVSGICTKEQCYTLIFESGGGPGTEPPPGNPNNGTGTTVATSKLNWSNSNGGTLPGSPSTGGLPNAPCSNNCAWYMEAPVQHFETNPNLDDITGDPCADAKPFTDAAKKLSETNNFTTAQNDIETATNIDHFEHGVTFGKDVNGNITTSPIRNGDAGGVTLNTGWLNGFADLHNHPNYVPPSPGDMYKLINVNLMHMGYNTRMVITPDGSVYAMVIANLSSATSFKNVHGSVNNGFGPDFPNDVFNTYYSVQDYFERQSYSHLEAQENAMAYTMDYYNTGIILLKRNTDGNFKRLLTKAVTISGVTTYATENCP